MGEILQSYRLTYSAINTATEEAGVFAQRFIVRLAEMVNDTGIFKGMKFRPSQMWDGKTPLDVTDPNSWVVRTIKMPIQAVMLPGVDGETHAKKAIKAMQQAIIDYTDYDADGKKFWTSFAFIGRVTIKDGIINADVEPEVWRLMLDFSQGFRAYELDVITRMKSKFAMKLYPYVCRQKDPTALTMTIEDCKHFLGVHGKYKKTSDFIEKCIDSAKKELDEMSPWTFDYELLKKKGKGRPSINAIRFIPRHQLKYESEQKTASEITAPVHFGTYTKATMDIMINKFGIAKEMLIAYGNLFQKASKVLDLNVFAVDMSLELDKRRGTEREVGNPAGWFISTLTHRIK